ncbi:septum formation family protein [Nocardioides sp. SYSU D00065]|uniref:septum formation family protein n=1 Tax=Nocardioides sp. SYSU D00065 TaxID=2817378 RepID=UPI001B3392F5|nr:septum formation family protein [Nocardioides sp. SYSU D00065]
MTRAFRALATALVLLVVATACTSPSAEPREDRPTSASPSPTGTAPPDPGPRPRSGQCHDLTFRQAVALVGRTAAVPCRRPHTAQTYYVGRLDLETESGHTRRADSRAAQRQARSACTARLPRHLGLTPRELRLSMARPVWFTPSPARADAGADWFRCDVVVVAAPRTLLRLPGRTRGWGATPAIAMCATAAPGTPSFRRVTCGSRHSWRAATSVDIPGRRLPAQPAIAARMESPCRDTARAQADDPLEFTWAEESPTREQWAAGQRYGICWVPA